jgi:lysophospholipase L1-like esterase
MAIRTVRLNGGSISATDIDGIVNIRDYGAIGDGSTDDTSAIAAAYTAAAGRPVFVPNGTFLVTTLPAVVDGDRFIGVGHASVIKYAGTGTLLALSGKQDIAFRSLRFHLSGVGSKALTLSGCFKISIDDCLFTGLHDGTTGTTYHGQKGLVLTSNTGNTRIHNCELANLGIAVETSCIENEMTNSRITNCHYGIHGVGGTANAGMFCVACEFIGDTDPDTCAAHVNIDGTANTWKFSECWFEGSDYGLIVGVFGSGGPSSFTLVGCKVAARVVGIQFNNCRQPGLYDCEFNADAGGTMTEIVFGGSPAGDEVIEGLAVNLVTTLRSDFADADFPQYWNIFRRGSFRSPNIHSTSNVTIDGTADTGNFKFRNNSPTLGKTVTAVDTDGNATWTAPELLGTPVFRTLRHSNGGQGLIGNLATVTALSARYVVRLPVTTTRWRILLSNYDTYAATSKTDLTGTKIIHGDHSRSLTSPAGETGDFVGSTATTIVGSSFTIPSNGTQYTGPWVTAAGDQFDAGVEHLIGIAYTCASQTIQYGAGRCWRWTNATSGVDPTVAASGATSTASYIPFDAVIEYECTSALPAWLVIGDSIYEGVAAAKGAAVSPTSNLRSPPFQWGKINDALIQNQSLYAVTAQTLANSSRREWTRQSQTGGSFTGAIIELGTNDVDASRTLAQVQADIMSVITNVRTAIGTDKPIYLANIPAHNQSGGIETVRTNVNDWIAQLPYGVKGTIDMDAGLRRAAAATTSDSALMATDSVHPNYQGQGVIAGLLRTYVKERPRPLV